MLIKGCYKCPGSVALNTKKHTRTHASMHRGIKRRQTVSTWMRLSKIRYISLTEYKELDGERASDDYLRLSSRSLFRCLASSTLQRGTGSVSSLLRREKGSGSHPHVRRDERRGADATAALASASPAPAPGWLVHRAQALARLRGGDETPPPPPPPMQRR